MNYKKGGYKMDLQEATMNLINSESNKSLKESIDWSYYKNFM